MIPLPARLCSFPFLRLGPSASAAPGRGDLARSPSRLRVWRLGSAAGLLGVLMGPGGTAVAEPSQLWRDYVRAQETGERAVLPNFSYAGYDYSESPIPDLADAEVFDVTDHGAVAGDGKHDDEAIQRTIDAAGAAGGGIVFFPPGRFLVSPTETVGENIFIRHSHVVLRGSGSGEGGTEIVKDRMKVNNGRFMFEFGPPKETRRGENITTLRGQVRRGGFTVEVDDTEALEPGQWVLLYGKSPQIARDHLAPLELLEDWTLSVSDGMQICEPHQVVTVEGDRVSFREPIHLDFDADRSEIVLQELQIVEGVGVEAIRFTGSWDTYPEEFVHHKDQIHDYAWNAVRFDNTMHSWMRDVEFKHWNQCVFIATTAGMTVENARFTGKKGHMSIHTRHGYGTLVKDSVDTAGHHHGAGLGYSAAGTVYLRHRMQREQRIDSHSGIPYTTLFDNIDGGQLWGNGGPLRTFPHHGKDFVFWNFRLGGGPDEYNFWRTDTRGNNTFALPIFAGLHGKRVKLEEGTYLVSESQGRRVRPLSLFEAQLELRLGQKSAAVR